MEIKGKKVLLMGLGILGGGVATARFLAEQGADLTITDLKDADYLKLSLDMLKEFKDIKFVLGEHREEDFLENEIIVINPDVSINNKFVKLAKKNGKQIENELTLFYKFCPTKKVVAITGTRGKTTTANWTYHLLKSYNQNTIIAGNSSENTFLGMLEKCDKDSQVVLEVPSYQLELFDEKRPEYETKVAIVTNIYQDHLSRHGNMEDYTKTKANIFRSQMEEDFLILNKDNRWSDFLLNQKPKAQVLFFTKDDNFSFVDKKDFIAIWGEHNWQNLCAAVLAVKIMKVTDESIKSAIATLPQIRFRQEKVFENEKFAIYNDTAATSSEATIAAINRFADGSINLILMAGGTDRELDFEDWARTIKQKINPKNLILLSGSATEKMKKAIGESVYNEFDTLNGCMSYALKLAKITTDRSIILFAPGAKSFEKFKNEFDRGEQFDLLVKKLLT